MAKFLTSQTGLASKLPRPFKGLTRKLPAHKTESDVNALIGGSNLTFKDLQNRLIIPVNNATPDQIESQACKDRGIFLARQERWDDLAEEIRESDQNRVTTRAGVPVADLLNFGARSDVVRAAEHALLHGRPAKGSDFFSGIEGLEAVLMDSPDCYAIALIVAHMHIDIGWAWRGADPGELVRDANREAFEAHFARARDILDAFPAHEIQSPSLCAARCALLPGHPYPAGQLVTEFERLIDLDIQNPRHMRALGNYLLPRWYGDFQKLDLQARRTAARTFEVWGAGGYSWVWFDALLVDPVGFATLEVDYFLDGVADILSRQNDQHIANLLCAHLYRSWQVARQNYHENGLRPDLAPALRHGFETVVKEHIREVHPLIWGHAEIGFENTSRIISADRLAQKGRETALAAVAMPFLKRLQSGDTVTFGPNGITQAGS